MIFKILSPFAFFAAYVVFLAGEETPFLEKWLNGSFALFLTLVACNVIRHHLLRQETAEPGPAEDHDPPSHPP